MSIKYGFSYHGQVLIIDIIFLSLSVIFGFWYQGKYGPFRTRRQARVPLWLALFLKRRRRCSICMPEWLQLGASSYYLWLLASQRFTGAVLAIAMCVINSTTGAAPLSALHLSLRYMFEMLMWCRVVDPEFFVNVYKDDLRCID